MKKTTQSILVVLATTAFTLSFAQNKKKDSLKEKEIEEVVMVGYTKKEKKTLTNSIGSVSEKVLASAPRANVATALQGTVAGLRVVQKTGQPGSSPSIQMRGGTGWSGSGSPLILIDGVPSNSFFSINNEDIESIDVMKDAAATAIYGARGANGVIIVTTKKGKKGKSNINFSTKTTYNFRRDEKLKYMNAAEFVRMNRLAIQAYSEQFKTRKFDDYLDKEFPAATGNNTTNSIYTTMILTDANKYLLNQPGWQKIEDPINPGQYLIFMDNNLHDLYYQPSTTEDYNVSVDGGNDKGAFYASLGYINDRGIVYGSGFRRISGTLNTSYKIRNNFKVSANISYTSTNQTPTYLNNDNWIFQRAAGLAPTARIYYNNPDGTLSDRLNPGVSLSFGNPLYYNDKFVRHYVQQRLTASMQLDWAFASKFNFMVRGSYFNSNDFKENFVKAYYDGGNYVDSRRGMFTTRSTLRNQVTSILSYKNTFGTKNHIDALVGLEYYKSEVFGSRFDTKNSPTDLIYTLNVAPELEFVRGATGTSRSAYSIGSLFSQVYYDYDNRYLLGLTFRADGTSKLDKNNRFDYFPGVSLGWNVHKESFFKESGINKVFSQIKPRVSYGVNGNIDNLSNYGVYGLYGTTSIYNGKIGYVNTVLPNFTLLWERVNSLNFGLDLSLFSNRVSLSADYFTRDIYNKIASLPLPIWTGFSSILRNIGIMQTKGIEAEIKVKVINNQDFKWNVGGNYYTFESYAKKLAPSSLPGNRIGGSKIYDPVSKTEIYVGGREEGKRIDDVVVSYIFDGIYRTQEEVDKANDSGLRVEFAQKQNVRFLGDAKWKDLNGDNVIDYRDRAVIGRVTPKFTGGFNTDFSYKNFNLYIRTDFAVGHLKFNYQRERSFTQKQGALNGFKEVLDSWSETNPDSDIPRFVFTDPQNNHSGNRLWEKADYLALREVTVSYNLPRIDKLFRNVRIYATGSNIAYITPYLANPESGGLEADSYPLPMNLTFGVSATF